VKQWRPGVIGDFRKVAVAPPPSAARRWKCHQVSAEVGNRAVATRPRFSRQANRWPGFDDQVVDRKVGGGNATAWRKLVCASGSGLLGQAWIKVEAPACPATPAAAPGASQPAASSRSARRWRRAQRLSTAYRSSAPPRLSAVERPQGARTPVSGADRSWPVHFHADLRTWQSKAEPAARRLSKRRSARG